MPSRLRNIDLGAGIMITWMVIYHVLMWQWGLEVPDWSITDPMLIPSDIHAFINPNGHLEVLNPCVLFPYLNFFMPWFFYKSGMLFAPKAARMMMGGEITISIRNLVVYRLVSIYRLALVCGGFNPEISILFAITFITTISIYTA